MSRAGTYSSMRSGIAGFLGDARRLYKVRTGGMAADIARTIEQKDDAEAAFRERTGSTLRGQRVLVVGAGQTRREVIALAIDNHVTAIDLDVVPTGWQPGAYVQLLRENGPVRTAKTVGRKVLGVDRRFTRMLCAELQVEKPNTATMLQMDASSMTFPDGSFDFVYSFSVFEHLPDPAAVLAEAKRVLRPGGVLDISLHLYSSEGGCHDLRIFAGDRAEVPYWAQLRPTVKHTVIESCFMNEWRLDRWNELFRSACPGCELITDRHHEPYGSELASELASIRAAGELTEYTDEEVLAVNLRCVWTKPT